MTKKKTKEGPRHYNPVLEPFAVELSKLKLDPANERKHGDRNLESIMGSLQKFGQQTPIVFDPKKMTILKGNGTFEAAKRLEWEKIIAIPTDLESEVEKAGYRVADNRTGELADWDMEALAATLQGLRDDNFDMGFMYTDDDLAYYMDGWDSNHDEVSKRGGHTDGIIDVLKIVTPQGKKDEVREALEPIIKNFEGVHFE